MQFAPYPKWFGSYKVLHHFGPLQSDSNPQELHGFRRRLRTRSKAWHARPCSTWLGPKAILTNQAVMWWVMASSTNSSVPSFALASNPTTYWNSPHSFAQLLFGINQRILSHFWCLFISLYVHKNSSKNLQTVAKEAPLP